MLKKIALGAAALLLVVSMALEFSATRAYAAKVDCDKVMAEVNAGKKGTEVAKDLGISASSVYRCKKKAKAGTGSTAAASSPAAAEAGPATGASPVSAASPATTKPKKHKKAKSGASPSPSAAASPGM